MARWISPVESRWSAKVHFEIGRFGSLLSGAVYESQPNGATVERNAELDILVAQTLSPTDFA